MEFMFGMVSGHITWQLADTLEIQRDLSSRTGVKYFSRFFHEKHYFAININAYFKSFKSVVKVNTGTCISIQTSPSIIATA